MNSRTPILTPYYSLLFTPDFLDYLKTNYRRTDAYSLIINYCNTLKKLRHNGTNSVNVPTVDQIIDKQLNIQVSEYLDLLRINLFAKKTFEEILVFSFWTITQMKKNQQTKILDLMNYLSVEDYLSLSMIEIQHNWSDQDLKSFCSFLKHQTDYSSQDSPHNLTWNQLRSLQSLCFDFSSTSDSQDRITKLFSILEKSQSSLNIVHLKFILDDLKTSDSDHWLINLILSFVKNLTSLKKLSICSNNEIHPSLIEQLLRLSLEFLEIQSPSQIKLNQHTRINSLSLNRAPSISMQFDKCKLIESLIFQSTPISINELIRFLNNLPKLQTLIIKSYNGQKRVLKTLPKSLVLETLVINGIEENALIELEPVLSHIFQKTTNSLKRLDVDCQLSDGLPLSITHLTVTALSDFKLFSNLQNLKTLCFTKTVNLSSLNKLLDMMQFLPGSCSRLEIVLPQQQNEEFNRKIKLFFIQLSFTKVQWLKIMNLAIETSFFEFISCCNNLFSIQTNHVNVLHLWKNLGSLCC
jgi:hypothetical protein